MFFDVTGYLFKSLYDFYDSLFLPITKAIEFILFVVIIIKLINTKDVKNFIKNNIRLISILIIIDLITLLISNTNNLIKTGTSLVYVFVFVLCKKYIPNEETIKIEKPKQIVEEIKVEEKDKKKVVRKRKTASSESKKKTTTKKTKE